MQISSAGAEIDAQSGLVQRLTLFGVGDPLGAEPSVETELTPFTQNPIRIRTAVQVETLAFVEDHHYGVIFTRKTGETTTADTAQQKRYLSMMEILNSHSLEN